MSKSPCHVSRFSLEFQLACLCCRATLTESEWVEIKRLLTIVDVPAFLELVIARHRIGPLAHAVLKQLPAQALPPGLMAPLSETTRDNAVKALRSTRTHIMLARWFAAAGIDWLPFKGVTVAERYYGDFAARQVNDLDIWVPPSKTMAARALLQAHEFHLSVANQHGDVAARGPRHLDYLTHYRQNQELPACRSLTRRACKVSGSTWHSRRAWAIPGASASWRRSISHGVLFIGRFRPTIGS